MNKSSNNNCNKNLLKFYKNASIFIVYLVFVIRSDISFIIK